MGAYLLRRLLLVIPTLFGIIAINFAVVQLAPGGPVEQMIAELRGRGSLSVMSGASADMGAGLASPGAYRGASGTGPAGAWPTSRKMFGFDKPPLTRFLDMVGGYLRFDFGRSFFRDQTVLALIAGTLPVSHLARPVVHAADLSHLHPARHRARRCTTAAASTSPARRVVLVGYAIPSFLFAILLVVLFAGGSFCALVSAARAGQRPGRPPGPGRRALADYAWHMVLPIAAIVAGGFASLTMLTKNCFLEEIRKQYTVTARAKGASEQRVLYGHVFRNAMLLHRRRLPAGLHRHPVHLGRCWWKSSSRSNGLGDARLPGGDPAGLSGDVRHPLHLHPDRPASCRSSATCCTPWSIRGSISRRGDEALARSPAAASPSSARTGAATPSFWIFLVLFVLSLFAEFIANDRPLLIRYDGHWYVPVLHDYSEDTFGREFLPTEADYTAARGATGDPRPWLDDLAGRSLLLRHDRQGRGPALRRRRRPGSIRSAPTTRRATCWRA